jgi:glutathione S-transferase
MKLYATPPSPRAFKVLATLHHLGLDAELVRVDVLNGENRTPQFLALNPNHRMPVLDDDGFVLWESNAIMQYLASKMPAVGLWPSDPRRQADVSRWQCWELAHWDPACATLIFERFERLAGQGDPDPAQVARGEASFQEFATLDGHLRRRDWLSVEPACRLSVGCWFTCAGLGGFSTDGFPAIERWYDRLQQLPARQRSIVAPPPLDAAVQAQV